MKNKLWKKRAVALAEYTVMLVLIFATIYLFKNYIARAISGRWKSTGDIYGHGRLYDPNLTLECAYDDEHHKKWYNIACFDNKCDCFTTRQTKVTCADCILGCAVPMCN